MLLLHTLPAKNRRRAPYSTVLRGTDPSITAHSPSLALNSTVPVTAAATFRPSYSTKFNAKRHPAGTQGRKACMCMLTAGRAQPVPVWSVLQLEVIDGWAPYFRTLLVQFLAPQHTQRILQVPSHCLGAGACSCFSLMLMCTLWTSIPCGVSRHSVADHPESSLSCQCPPLASNSQPHSRCPFLRGSTGTRPGVS